MTVIAVALLVGLLASNVAWLVHSDRSQHLHRHQISELLTRIQHPALVNPLALEEPPPPPPDTTEATLERAEFELVGTASLEGVPNGVRPVEQE